MNIHTGRTPYSCPWCPKTFANGSNCRIHKRKSHPVELAEYEAKNGISSGKFYRITQFVKKTLVVPHSFLGQFIDSCLLHQMGIKLSFFLVIKK